jgi:hypothetical protein
MSIEQLNTRARRLMLAVVVVALIAAIWVPVALAGGNEWS